MNSNICRKNCQNTSSGFRAGVTRYGDGGPLKAVAAPLTPRPRGTIYKAQHLILERVCEVPLIESSPNKPRAIIERTIEQLFIIPKVDIP